MTDIKLPPMQQALEPDLEGHEYELWGQNVKADFVTVEKAIDYAREAVRLNAQSVPDVGQLVNSLVSAAFRKGELWERCQGKGWPESVSAEFKKLRDETIPKTIAQLQLALSAAPAAPQPAQPLTDDPCPGCQVGGVCKTPECGRLKLPVDHPLRTGVKND